MSALLILRFFGQALGLKLGQAADGGSGNAVIVNGGPLQLVGFTHVKPDKVFLAVQLTLDVVHRELGCAKGIGHLG